MHYERSCLAFSSLCLSPPIGNCATTSYSNSTHHNFDMDIIFYRKRPFKQNTKVFNRSINMTATIKTNKTIETDDINNYNVSATNPNNIPLGSEDKTYISNNATTKTHKSFSSFNTNTDSNDPLNNNNTATNTTNVNFENQTNGTTTITTPAAIRRHDRSEKLKVEFDEQEKKLAAAFDRTRLSADDWLVHAAHAEALSSRHFTYDDPATGNRVMTRLCHFLRGRCCGNACRHCVYNHENVPESVRQRRVFNSSFWVDGEPLLLQELKSTTCGWGALR